MPTTTLTVPVKSVVAAATEIMKPANADRYFQNDDATVDLVIDEPEDKRMTYIVIADDGNVSYGFKDKKAEKDCNATPQSFDAEATAMKRAKELAKSSPGEVIGVYRLVKTALCRVADPEIVDQR